MLHSNRTYPHTLFRPSRIVARELDLLLNSLRAEAKVGLHLGAGGKRISNLINCDLHDHRADKRVDSMKLSEFGDGEVDYIESHHMIEHLSFADAHTALKEWYRVLRVDGFLVLSCPEITRICILWLMNNGLHCLFDRTRQLNYIRKMLCGSQEHDGMFHLSMYDSKSLTRLLSEAGFKVVFSHAPYPIRPTPSLFVIASRLSASPKADRQPMEDL